MKRQLLLLLALLFCSIGTALAQKVIHGTVISKDDSEPIMGATVRVVGHNVGAATNLDGKFTINLPAGATKLSVSYVGMHTQEVEARDGMTVQMISSAKAIDEIIVVAYGTAKKSSFTGSAVSVDASKIDKIQAADASKALEGTVAGISVTSSSGLTPSASAVLARLMLLVHRLSS